MKRIIKWQSQHLEIDSITGKLQDPEAEEEYYDEEDYDDECEHNVPIQNVMSTPFGFWKIDDTMNPYKQFKMWMAHTNFTITEEIVNIVKEIPGVEVLQVMTRYRFIVGVGELFEIRDVRTNIEGALNCNQDENDLINDAGILEEVHELKKALSQDCNQWAIYIFPNGQIDFTTSEEAAFGQRLNIFKQAVDHSSGVLIESDNE